MPYQLRDDLSFCRLNGHLVFLDVREDRYFQLPDTIERELIAFLDGDESPRDHISWLLKRNVLVEVPVADNSAASLAIERPIRSAVEDDSAQPSVNFFTYLEVYATVRSTARQLKTRKLKEVLDELVVYRQTRTAKYAGCTIETMEQRILKAASAFRRARRYVPVEPSCLLDSLSMTRFLSRRGPHASIVFGVTLDPFSAHCWVQAEGMTLNETIGQANAHTPILVL